MLKNLLLFSFLCFFTIQLKAQTSCATDDAVLRKDIIKNRPFWSEKPRSGAVQFVPIKFHIVGKTDGTGAMNASEILEQLCYINQIFAPDFKFYLADGGFDYTFNDSYYDLKNTATFDNLIKNVNKKVANVYLVKTFKLDGQVGFSDAIYAPTQDVILVQYPSLKASFKYNIAHELGHLLGLSHPFASTVTDNFSNLKPNEKLPSGTECMNGTNCKIAGDGFCDTPPDVISLTPTGDCKKLPFNLFDACGDSIKPILNLLMSYRNCDTYIITNEQRQAMDFTLNLGNKKNYDKSFTGATPITPSATNGFFTKQIQTPPVTVDKVTFNWDAVKNAYGYVLQVSKTSNFATFVVNTFSKTNSQFVELPLNKSYYWRVLPFTETACADWTNVPKWDYLATFTSSEELAFVNDFLVYPNPTNNENINVKCTVNQQFDCQINLYSAAGSLVKKYAKYTFHEGENNISLDTQNLPKGFYFLEIKKDNRNKIIEKIVVN